jgi:nitrogen fixation/metabolism regulation signal transduction histidine kinase
MNRVERKAFWKEWWSWFKPVLAFTELGWIIAYVFITIFYKLGLIQSHKGWLSLVMLDVAIALIILIVFGRLIFKTIKTKKNQLKAGEKENESGR